jgi:branched-chain amino acid aminotransferase
LFETMVAWNGRPFRWKEHLARLQAGAEVLRLRLPATPKNFLAQTLRLLAADKHKRAVVRLAISRGVGQRGYSIKGANSPTWVISVHPLPAIKPGVPPGWHLRTASVCLPQRTELARYKTANKLAQIVAKAEAEDQGADEALLLNDAGEVAETSSANLFWLHGNALVTPPLRAGALPGITRGMVFELARQLKLEPSEITIKPDKLQRMDAVFLTLSTLGMVEVLSLDGRAIGSSSLVRKLHAAYWKLVAEETKCQET